MLASFSKGMNDTSCQPPNVFWSADRAALLAGGATSTLNACRSCASVLPPSGCRDGGGTLAEPFFGMSMVAQPAGSAVSSSSPRAAAATLAAPPLAAIHCCAGLTSRALPVREDTHALVLPSKERVGKLEQPRTTTCGRYQRHLKHTGHTGAAAAGPVPGIAALSARMLANSSQGQQPGCATAQGCEPGAVANQPLVVDEGLQVGQLRYCCSRQLLGETANAARLLCHARCHVEVTRGLEAANHVSRLITACVRRD